jgi:hypothetical protein
MNPGDRHPGSWLPTKAQIQIVLFVRPLKFYRVILVEYSSYFLSHIFHCIGLVTEGAVLSALLCCWQRYIISTILMSDYRSTPLYSWVLLTDSTRQCLADCCWQKVLLSSILNATDKIIMDLKMGMLIEPTGMIMNES